MKNYKASNKVKSLNTLLHLCLSFLIGISFANAQNHVFSGSEMAIFSSIDLATSTAWTTARTATPGYYAWTNGSSSYTGSDDSHNINGYVKKYGVDAFTFPVGTGSDLRTLAISAPSTATDAYGVAWIVGNPTSTGDPTNANAMHAVSSFSGPVTAVSTVGQWDWVAVSGTGVGLTITVSIPAVSGSGFTTAADLRLVGWNGTAWVSLGTNGASGVSENSTLTGTMIAGIQAIGIGTITASPVTVGTPAAVMGVAGTTVTGNPPTNVSGGTSPYTYSDGTSDILCTAPTTPTLALPAGKITGLNTTTGTHNVNTTGLTAGTYEYCIKVCDASGTNCTISKHIITVTVACVAGNVAPVPR